MSVRVLIAEYDQETRHALRDLVCSAGKCEVVGLARDGQEAVQMAMQYLPDIAFISYDLPGISGPQTCEIMSALGPGIMSVLVAEAKSQDRIVCAMRSGARALVARPLEEPEVQKLIASLADVRERRNSVEVQEWKDPARFPKVISVTGGKGGVGKTTIAINLAVLLAKRLPNKVALIDLYTQFGDVAAMLNLTPRRTIAELVPDTKELDFDLVENYITKHPCGVHVLVTSLDPVPLDAVSIECLDNLLYVLKHRYRYVVVDVPPMLHTTTLHVLARSNIILLVANLFDVTTATDTKKFYDALREESIAEENIKVVLNRVSKVNRLHTADIEQMFDCDLLAHIPNDGRLVNAVNQGMPLMVNDGDSPIGRSMSRLATAVAGTGEENSPGDRTSKKKSIFRTR